MPHTPPNDRLRRTPTTGSFPDRFEVRGEIGKGLASRVHLGWDRHTEQAVAIKVLLAEHRTDPQAFARFRQEIELLGLLEHPYIVGLIDHDLWGDEPAMALELAAGGSLSRRLLAEPTPDARQLLTWTLDVLDALDHVHRRGIVHRDIKPGNLLLAEDGTIRLCDFGIARRPASPLTQAGSVLGTPTFMPPEQAHDPHSAGPDSDLYALGATLYVSLVRRPAVELVAPHLRGSSLDDLPDPVRPIVDRATAPRVEDRYHDALAMHGEVERALLDLGGALR